MRTFFKIIRTLLCKIKYKNWCKIANLSYIDDKCKFEGENRIGKGTTLYSSEVGFGSYVGNDNFLIRVKIGKYCSIGNDVKVVSITHPINGVSTHPAFYSVHYGGVSYVGKNKETEILRTNLGWHCEIGNDVWIGSQVLIRGGVKIGDGAVVAMGSVVTNDVPPYAIVGGVPAKIIKYRFNDNTVNALLSLKWWEKDEMWIKNNAEMFMDVKTILEME